jgi:hypothetical protein
MKIAKKLKITETQQKTGFFLMIHFSFILHGAPPPVGGWVSIIYYYIIFPPRKERKRSFVHAEHIHSCRT